MKKLILVLSLLFVSNVLFSQLKAVSGKVTGFKKYAFKNIQVSAKKAQTKVLTDVNGEFSIICQPNDVLVFESKSTLKTKYKIKNPEDSVKVNLVFKNNKKSREYAIGYGIMSKEDLTYAVSNLSHQNNNFAIYSNIYDMIRGRIPGVQVSGEQIIIRGVNSINSDVSALILVDGVQVSSLSHINPNDVKKIDVLKDASASIYGSRGANGVVLITTVGSGK